MRIPDDLFANNRAWADSIKAQDAEFFNRLAQQQSPQLLWIGCSDSRVPANQIVGLLPGEIFVHRNVANVVVHTDLNCLSVMQFAVDVLQIRHIIVCGHYGCGGVTAALNDERLGLVSNWLRHVRDVFDQHRTLIEAHPSPLDQRKRLCELNVIEQVVNVCRTTVVQDAWARGQALAVHGWIYGIEDGLLRDLHISIEQSADLLSSYRQALARLG